MSISNIDIFWAWDYNVPNKSKIKLHIMTQGVKLRVNTRRIEVGYFGTI